MQSPEKPLLPIEEQFKIIADTAPVLIWVSGVDKLCYYFNAGWLKFTGRSMEEEFGNGWAEGVHPDDMERCLEIYTTSFDARKEFKMEYRLRRHDGEYRWLVDTGVPRYTLEGEFAGFIGSCMDINEIKIIEQRKIDFIGMVSHELKTPLTTLTAVIQVTALKLKKDPDPFVAEAMDIAVTQVKKMSTMINSFLNISRLESGKLQVYRTNFDLVTLINDVIKENDLTFSTHKIFVDICASVLVYADRDKIGAVISNLISNAIKYSPKGNSVKINCRFMENYIQVSVADQGIGLAPEDLSKIFDRYYRVENSHTKHISGFGIGLYLSAEIIERHQGKIWAESEKGTGSTFYFSLPLNQ